ncbi:hypothetical protein BC829DRAFT_418912 [Chytridium lagenaria]|nr:hypothetical protein BC829DRAFT_418912 [Chytridium lagenaria]
MTRTRRISGQGSALTFHDRHLQRNGGDVRGTVKKNGSGSYNWGSHWDDLDPSFYSSHDDLDFLDMDSSAEMLGKSPETKIQVMDESKFKMVKEMAYSSSP